MKLEAILEAVAEQPDEGLRSIETRCQELLAQHDRERKEKALSEARASLAAVGLTLKDLARKSVAAKPKGPVYHAGRMYQHPANKALVWPGKGKKPAWLTTLEAEGGKAVEIANDNVAPGKAANDVAPLKKTG